MAAAGEDTLADHIDVDSQCRWHHVRSRSEELMTNIAQHSKGRVTHHSFDVHVFVMADRVRLTLRDGGRPFDPIRAGKTTDTEQPDSDIPNLGLLIAANIIPDISYKYMYGLNIVLIKVN